MASNRGRKHTSAEFPSGQAAKKIAEYCTVSEGPEEGKTYNTDINSSGVPLKDLANLMTIVYPVKTQDLGSPLYRRILYTWGLPNTLRSGLRRYRCSLKLFPCGMKSYNKNKLKIMKIFV